MQKINLPAATSAARGKDQESSIPVIKTFLVDLRAMV